MECEKPVKLVDAKVSPSTLNLKSNGNWVTVKVSYPIGDVEPQEIKLNVGEGSLSPESVKFNPKHIILKFSRADLQDLCTLGDTTVTISFSLEGQEIELRDTIKVINMGNNKEQVQISTNADKVKPKPKSNNGKAKDKQ